VAVVLAHNPARPISGLQDVGGLMPVPEWEAVFGRSTSANGRPVLEVSGEIDLAVAPRFANELASLVDAADGEAVVDLASVGFMDSSGVRELLIANRAAVDTGGVLVLRAPSEQCRHVLRVSGALSEFQVQDHE